MNKVDISDLIGVPFKDNGRTKEGYDCFGLVQEIYRRYGYDIGEYHYCVTDDQEINGLIKSETKAKWREIDYKAGEPIPTPALIAIRFGVPSGTVNHCALALPNGKFIHSRMGVGVCIDSIYSIVWKHRIEGIYEWVGDSNE